MPAERGPSQSHLVLHHARGEDAPALRRGPVAAIDPGRDALLDWAIPDVGGQPILDIGIEMATIEGSGAAPTGCTIYLDRLGWSGPADVRLGRPVDGGEPGGVPGWTPWTTSTAGARSRTGSCRIAVPAS